MNLGLLEVDLDNITISSRFSTMSGYTQQELLGNNAIDIFVNEGGKGVLKAKIN
jgi:hypothetical protein